MEEYLTSIEFFINFDIKQKVYTFLERFQDISRKTNLVLAEKEVFEQRDTGVVVRLLFNKIAI